MTTRQGLLWEGLGALVVRGDAGTGEGLSGKAMRAAVGALSVPPGRLSRWCAAMRALAIASSHPSRSWANSRDFA